MNPNGTDTLAEHVQLVRLADMAAWERNPHKHPESQLSTLASLVRRFGFTSLPVLATYPGCETGFVSSGNGRLAVLRLLKSQYPQNPPPGIGVAPDGEWLIPCRPMAFPSKAEAEAQGLSDNWVASMPGVEDDTEMLADILRDLDADGVDFSQLGKDADELAKLLADEANNALAGDGTGSGATGEPVYTNKIKIPIYEPKGDKPPISALYDDAKTKALRAEIDATPDLPPDVAAFLRLAADRHTSFHFRNIAEFYCHADPKVQDLMERSGMVIIDYDKAVEYGFVKMTKKLAELTGGAA